MDNKREKKDDDEGFVPFQNLDKGIVLQEKRIFNETPLNPRKCCQLLTKILYLISQGEKFTKTEATELFFATTRLFQSKDIPLRRMVYLVLKELIPLADDVIMVMSSLTKDINSKSDLYKANAIRAITGITDATMLVSIERFLKQGAVDKEPAVASAALIAGIHLMKVSPETIKRWVTEVQEGLNHKSPMVQYHSLGLLHQIKQHDRLAVSKLVTSLIKSPLRSSHAHCLLIRFTAQVMEEDPISSVERGYFNYLETCLRNKSDMVIYEAARAICNLKQVTARELSPAVTVLQLFLSSPKPSLRFAAVRTLNRVAQTHPNCVVTCNPDLENLISDSNRSIATLAITTLLKTGSENSVERLLKQISGFMGEITDEFKVVVIDAIKLLTGKFPAKYRSLLSFLSAALRDEGGFEYKKAIVDSILYIIQHNPESKESGLTHLCEFIEDCEYTYLSTKILHLLGEEGPTTSVPSRFIRYIYNRISLENASVRAAAVSALAKFALRLPALQPQIAVLLRRCALDHDDEVRDRALLCLELLPLSSSLGHHLLLEPWHYPTVNLERALLEYKKNPTAQPFSLRSVSLIAPVSSSKTAAASSGSNNINNSNNNNNNNATAAVSGSATAASGATASGASEEVALYVKALRQLPEFASFGAPLVSSKPAALTESETEYNVKCVKHVFADGHIVLQFWCTNTLAEQVLANVTVKMDVSGAAKKGADLKVESFVPLKTLQYGQPGATYVVLRRNPSYFVTGSMGATLKFVIKEIDPSTGEPEEPGYDDEYQLEPVELSVPDYMTPTPVNNFAELWEQLGDEFEVVETYALTSLKTLQEAVQEIANFLGMLPVDRTDKVPPKKTKHLLLLAGQFAGSIPALASVKMKVSEGVPGVQIELTVRSANDDVSTLLAGAI